MIKFNLQFFGGRGGSGVRNSKATASTKKKSTTKAKKAAVKKNPTLTEKVSKGLSLKQLSKMKMRTLNDGLDYYGAQAEARKAETRIKNSPDYIGNKAVNAMLNKKVQADRIYSSQILGYPDATGKVSIHIEYEKDNTIKTKTIKLKVFK